MSTFKCRPADALETQLEIVLAQESPRAGMRLAQPVLDGAMASGNVHLQAPSLARIAECECLLCDYREAQAKTTCAAQVLQDLGDLAGESNALATLAKASCALGRNQTAVEASLLAVELAKRSRHDEGALSQDLKVPVSIGVSKAEPYDTLEALLKRSDVAIYTQKTSPGVLACS